MIVLHKKKIILYAYFIGITVFAFIYAVASFKNNSIETMSLPVSNKVVTLDAGHGLPDKRRHTG